MNVLGRICNFRIATFQTGQKKFQFLQGFTGFFFRKMSQAVENTANSDESTILRPPKAVFGMTELDKDKFSMSVDFQCVRVEAKWIEKLKRSSFLNSILLNAKKIQLKQIIPDPNDPSKRLMLLDPDKVKENDGETQNEIIQKILLAVGEDHKDDVKFSTTNQQITFQNWQLPVCFKAILPFHYSSYTQIGHIIHCSFVDELMPYKKVIAQLFIEKIRGCRTVVMKTKNITNVYRNLDLELLAGEKEYITQHREGGITYKMNYSTVYWNSRLGHEHERIIQKFDRDSLVYDACAGIGPFALPATKQKQPRVMVANDLNPESVRWLRENVKINKIPEKSIQVFNLDGCEFLRTAVADSVVENILKDAQKLRDREENEKGPEEQRDYSKLDLASGAHVIMNLPAFAVNFLPTFRGLLHNRFPNNELPKGVNFSFIVYCYLFTKSSVDVEDDFFERQAREMVSEKLDWPDVRILNAHNVRCVSSRKYMFCMEIELPWKFLMAERDESKEWNPQDQEKSEVHEDDEVMEENSDIAGKGDGQPAEKRIKLNQNGSGN